MQKHVASEKWTPVTGSAWRRNDLSLLEELRGAERSLPAEAPRALLSVRLSALKAETTSPIRQELDLRAFALERGYRVVGVARDLNVSATRVPPWRRRELGQWLNERVPEFEVLVFWKLDRFVRRLTDLSTMNEWCLRHAKNLVSLHDTIDLSSASGQATAELIAGIAEIETAGTSMRVASLWEYARAQPDWLVGKPPYGYTLDDRGKLVIDPQAYRVLHWCLGAARRGVSARRMTTVLIRARVPTGGGGRWTASTLLRRLRNPALKGLRVEEDRNGGARRSQVVLGRDGIPIKVADHIFTEAEWRSLQAVLDLRAKSQPARRKGGATEFLGVLVCADCGTNMTVHRTHRKQRAYTYLRCRNCPSGGLGAPDPEAVYSGLTDAVVTALGAAPARVREYVPGTANHGPPKSPGSMVSAPGHWTLVHNGDTFRDRWKRGSRETMAEDLRGAGITCKVHRRKVPKARAPEIRLELSVPKGVADRLVIRKDAFTD
ncbi:recombinase family protein [Streptomyces platensis]|uniref:recombinase family protein n=1 Tax=Streptomyces platensis TaxID=58346 RepID=UPI001F1D9387|nr:recombinase family protein [Streptomyces platensis]